MKNKNLSKKEKKIIKPYSVKKIKIKPKLLYSTLNPETNSLSLSEKSKGIRFISAIILKVSKINKGKKKRF